MTSLNWVIGAGGLLGSAVTRRVASLNEELFDGPAVGWGGPDASADLESGLQHLIDESAGRRWRVLWCAGAGVTGSSTDALHTEVARFERLVSLMSELPAEVQMRGALFVASSAGAVYGGSHGAPFDEHSAVRPLGDYGTTKIAIESAARRMAEVSRIRCVVGRIANLYGPGQSLAKPQGLISHLCRAHVLRAPISIYVPLDTLRDYIFVDDCAALIIDCMKRIDDHEQGLVTKVLGSGRSISVGALLGEFRRVIGQRPEIVMGSSPVSSQQSRDLRLRSVIWPDLDHRALTNLADGMARTLEDIRAISVAAVRQS